MRVILDNDEVLVIYPSKDCDPNYCDCDAGVGFYDDKNKNSFKNLCWTDEDVVRASCGNFCLSLGRHIDEILDKYQTHLKGNDLNIASTNLKTIYDYLAENKLLLVCEPRLKDKFTYYLVDKSRFERLNNVYFKIKSEYESLNELTEYINSIKDEFKL